MMTPRAAKHFEAGRRLFAIQEFDSALKEFKAGYLIDPQPEFLYAIAQSERLLNDCRDADLAYNQYLHTFPTPPTDAVTKAKYDNATAMAGHCTPGSQPSQAGTSTAPPSKPGTPTKPSNGKGTVKPSSTPTPDVPPPAETQAVDHRRLGALSFGVGAAIGLAVGITGLVLHGNNEQTLSDDHCGGGSVFNNPACVNAYNDAYHDQNLAIAGFVAGGVFGAVSGTLFYLAYRNTDATPPAPTSACGPGPGTIGLACVGRF
jgi:hypothetical protein